MHPFLRGILFFFLVPLFAQTIALEDDKVLIGKLDNGLTYYIRENPYPKQKACLRLIVKAGSLHEEDHEQGIAHFVEHMVFKGTKHFQGHEVIQYLESLGAAFGPDINAETDFTHTRYLLNLPLEKDCSLEQGILILSEWAHHALMENDAIEKERKVILDEALLSNGNLGQSGQFILHQLLDQSRYHMRYPIGKEEIIRHASPEIIRQFYHKWYQPDRMAVIAVGDFSGKEVENYIKKHFSSIPANVEAYLEPDDSINTEIAPSIITVEDLSLQQTVCSFMRLEKDITPNPVTKAYIKDFLLNIVFHAILNERLGQLAQKNPPPFVSSGAVRADFSWNFSIMEYYCSCFEDRPLEGFKALRDEILCLKLFGPTQQEFASIIKDLQKALVFDDGTLYSEEHDHEGFSDDYEAHFMVNEPLFSPEKIDSLFNETLQEISIEDLCTWSQTSINLAPFHIIYITPKKVVNNEAIIQLLQSPMELSPPTEIKESLPKQTFIQEKTQKKESSLIATLPNGLKVFFCPIQSTANLELKLFGWGGCSYLPHEYLSSASVACDYLLQSGFGEFSEETFLKFLNSKGLNVTLAIERNFRSVSIRGSHKELRNMFMLLRSLFTEKHYNPSDWNNIIEKQNHFDKNAKNSSGYYLTQQFEALMHSDHPLFKKYPAAYAKESFAIELLEKAFANPKEFYLIVAGNYDPNTCVQNLIEIMNFTPNGKSFFPQQELPLDIFPKDPLDVCIKRGNRHGYVNLFAYSAPYAFTSTYPAQALEKIIERRLLKKLRLELGAVYAPQIRISFPFSPSLQQLEIFCSFLGEMEMTDILFEAALQEIQDLAEKGPTEDEILLAKALLRQQKKSSLQSLDGWIETSLTYLTSETPWEKLLNYPSLIEEQITKENLWNLAIDCFKQTPVIKMQLLPDS